MIATGGASGPSPTEKNFETGFPHGASQFISTAATGWATIALAYTLEEKHC